LSRDFTRSSKMAILLKMFFCTEDPVKNSNITTTPLVYRKHPKKTRGLAIGPLGMGWRRRRPDSGKPTVLPAREAGGVTTRSPRAWEWPKFGWGSCRCGRMAMAGGGGRGGSVLATASARPGLQAAYIGPTGSRGGSRMVGRTGG
jgi:hypothetical protein